MNAIARRKHIRLLQGRGRICYKYFLHLILKASRFPFRSVENTASRLGTMDEGGIVRLEAPTEAAVAAL